MKTFNGKTIAHKPAPTPKKNDIWVSKTGIAVLVLAVYGERGNKTHCLCQREGGGRFEMGLAWFDNKEYKYEGYLI